MLIEKVLHYRIGTGGNSTQTVSGFELIAIVLWLVFFSAMRPILPHSLHGKTSPQSYPTAHDRQNQYWEKIQSVPRSVLQHQKAIDKAATTGDKYQFIDPVFDLTDELEQCETPFDAVRPILELIESSPNIDFGGPGPLGSFMEKFYHEGYEEELVASLKRKPTITLLRSVQTRRRFGWSYHPSRYDNAVPFQLTLFIRLWSLCLSQTN
jgi:hypothetical protein